MTKDKFINTIVFGWIKGDLENISKVRTVIPGEGNANFPLAMCTIMYMDLLGSYLLGTAKGGLEANIREYLTCFKTPTDYPPELLNDLFRNGLGHDYFARGGISRSNMRPPMVNDPKIGVVLDADSLLNDFLDSLTNFKIKLIDSCFNNRFNEAKNDMEERYRKHQSIINLLPKPQVQIKTFPPTRVSGASGGTAIYT